MLNHFYMNCLHKNLWPNSLFQSNPGCNGKQVFQYSFCTYHDCYTKYRYSWYQSMLHSFFLWFHFDIDIHNYQVCWHTLLHGRVSTGLDTHPHLSDTSDRSRKEDRYNENYQQCLYSYHGCKNSLHCIHWCPGHSCNLSILQITNKL